MTNSTPAGWLAHTVARTARIPRVVLLVRLGTVLQLVAVVVGDPLTIRQELRRCRLLRCRGLNQLVVALGAHLLPRGQCATGGSLVSQPTVDHAAVLAHEYETKVTVLARFDIEQVPTCHHGPPDVNVVDKSANHHCTGSATSPT